MKVIQLASGKVNIKLTVTEFAALQKIVATGYKLARAENKGQGFGAFADGLEVTETREARKSNNPNFGKPAADDDEDED